MTQGRFDNEQPVHPEPERLIGDLDALKAYFDPLRQRIIRATADRPRSVHEIASELGVPFTRLYYHIKMLERHGIIRVVATRELSGAVEEKYYQVSARLFVIDRDLLAVRPAGELPDVENLETMLVSVLDATRRDIRSSAEAGVIDLEQRPPHPASLLLERSVSAISADRAEDFHQRLSELVGEFSAGSADTDGYYAFAASLYPTIQTSES